MSTPLSPSASDVQKEIESVLENDEAYGSNVTILNYSSTPTKITGKFKDSWNNRVFDFTIDEDGVGYKPSINLDSVPIESQEGRFDSFSDGYLSGIRIDRQLTGKRTKKPKCGATSFGCGYSCVGLTKVCRITSGGKKIEGHEGSNISKERLIKLVTLAKKLNSEGDKTTALARYEQVKSLKGERDKHTLVGKERQAERLLNQPSSNNGVASAELTGAAKQQTNKSKFKKGHDLLPLSDDWENFKRSDVISKISDLTGMTKSEATKSAKAVNAFTDESYERIRKAEYAGRETPQIIAINRYLDKMPKFSGEIFRGKQFKSDEDLDAFVEKLKNNHSYELPAMSSFTSDKEIAVNFAKGEGGTSARAIKSLPAAVFKITGNKSGVTAKGLSTNVEEDEVLVKKGARYRLSGKTETIEKDGKKITIIPLEEY